MELVDIGDQPDPKIPDFSRGMSTVIGELAALRSTAKLRGTSGHEDYIVSRLGSQPWPGAGSAEVLDPLPLYACIRLSEVLGAVALDGPDAEMHGISDTGLHERQAAGFDIAVAGVGSVHALLDRLRERHGRRSGHSGPQALFGRLYLWLAHQSRDPAYEAIREIVRDHCRESLALAPGGTIAPFGETVDRRRLHSVRSAAVEYGLNPVTLRKVLTSMGAVAADRRELIDDMLTFDADEHAELLSDLSSSLELKDAAAYLGMPVSQAELLVREGVLLPWVGERQGMRKRRFRKADLDGFLGMLTLSVDPRLADEPGLSPLPAAARAACRRLADVVRMLAQGRLKRVGLKDGATSYANILVDPDEIRADLRTPPSDVATMSEASAETGLPPHVLRSLGRLGVLPTIPTGDPSESRSSMKVAAEDLRLFRERYVSLVELADHHGTTPRLLWNRLGKAGVSVAIDHRAVGAAIYWRQDIPDVSKLNLVPWPAGKRS